MAHISVVYHDCEVGKKQTIFVKDMDTEAEALEFSSKFIDSFNDLVESNNIKNILNIVPFESFYNMSSSKRKFPSDIKALFTGREGDLLTILYLKKANGRYDSLKINISSEVGWWNNTLSSSFTQKNIINKILNIFNKI